MLQALVCRVPNESATCLGFFCPNKHGDRSWGRLLYPAQLFGENGWSGDGPRLSTCCRAAHSMKTEGCLFPGYTRDTDSPQVWLLPCRTCMRLAAPRNVCPQCLFITCEACLHTTISNECCETCKEPRGSQTSPEQILQQAKLVGIMRETIGCINILLFGDEKDSNYKNWAIKHKATYTTLCGAAFAVSVVTDTHAIVPTISTPALHR
jgi:hypothetical protein